MQQLVLPVPIAPTIAVPVILSCCAETSEDEGQWDPE
jgi:hypothetical protein